MGKELEERGGLGTYEDFVSQEKDNFTTKKKKKKKGYRRRTNTEKDLEIEE